MKVSRIEIREIIKNIIREYFTIPKGNWNSGYELYTEEDSEEVEKSHKSGAGFLIGRVFPNGDLKFLGLVAPIETRESKGGYYDIPKGKLKKGEGDLEGAKRECREESGIEISASDIVGNPVSNKKLTIFAAMTDQDPLISPNPESGIIEHQGASWISREEIENLCLSYLKPYVKKLAKQLVDSLDKN